MAATFLCIACMLINRLKMWCLLIRDYRLEHNGRATRQSHAVTRGNYRITVWYSSR